MLPWQGVEMGGGGREAQASARGRIRHRRERHGIGDSRCTGGEHRVTCRLAASHFLRLESPHALCQLHFN